MPFEISPASAEDRLVLSRLRSTQWRKELTVEQYLLRNRRIYAHPFGQRRMETHTLRDEAGKIVTSFDLLRVPLATPREILSGVLVASVLTPPEERGKGHSSRLLSWYFDAHPDEPGVLYSDIDPSFYQRFGFTARPTVAIRLAPRESAVGTGERLRPTEFVAELAKLRRANLAASGRAAGALIVDEEFLDWHLERYRLFAELAGARLPETLFFKLTHQSVDHLLAAVPHFLASRLELLWKYPGCGECEGVAQAMAARLGLSTVLFWETDPVRSGSRECPMIRVPTLGKGVFFSDPQYIDSW